MPVNSSLDDYLISTKWGMITYQSYQARGSTALTARGDTECISRRTKPFTGDMDTQWIMLRIAPELVSFILNNPKMVSLLFRCFEEEKFSASLWTMQVLYRRLFNKCLWSRRSTVASFTIICSRTLKLSLDFLWVLTNNKVYNCRKLPTCAKSTMKY